MNRASVWLTRLAAAFAMLGAAGVHAGGPMSICNDAAKTPIFYSPATVNLNYDLGNLGPRSKAQADAIVTNAVALWTNVPTATITIGRGADLPVDVTIANYSSYLSNSSDGINPVIYDTDGSITDDYFGVGAKSSVLGFAGSSYFLAPTCRYAEGQAVINGFIGVTDTTMSIVLAHEIGHLIGLDHTQLDNAQGGLASSNYPLMYPFVARNVLTLHEDDVAAVSALYPDVTLNSVYGQVSGTFVLADGVTPVRGANLWATETTTNKVYSIVSDYRTQNTGFFKLLLPPGNYNLRAGAIHAGFDSGSGVGPYSDVFPTSLSFQPPLYTGGVAMPTLTLGNSSPLSIVITAGCAATVTFRFDGTGSVADCAGPPPAAPSGCTISPIAPSATTGATARLFTASCSSGSPTSYAWTVDGSSVVGSANTYTTVSNLGAGPHTVAFRASNAGGASNPATATTLTVNAVAVPSGCTISPIAPSATTGATARLFTASCSSGSPTSYAWTVDGSAVAGSANTYTTVSNLGAGAHTVAFTASNAGGASNPATSTVLTVTVLPPAPMFRAYLAPTGVDSNPCTLIAPCRLLPAALAAVIDGGEIWMLASGNYNTAPVNVNKSVTILAVPSALGSVVAQGGNAINVATAGVRLTLRNLVVVPVVGGGGTGGINMTAGAALTVDSCLIANLPGSAISVATGAGVEVTDSTIRQNGNVGLWVTNGARATVTRTTISGNAGTAVLAQGSLGGTTTADIADSTLDANLNGVVAYSTNAAALVKVSVRDSQLVRNTAAGAAARSDSGALTTLSVSNNVISNNGSGIAATSAGATVWASGNTVSDNGTGLDNGAGGLLQSAGDNAVRNNGINSSGVISPAPEM